MLARRDPELSVQFRLNVAFDEPEVLDRQSVLAAHRNLCGLAEWGLNTAEREIA
jgi:hypothetical protein